MTSVISSTKVNGSHLRLERGPDILLKPLSHPFSLDKKELIFSPLSTIASTLKYFGCSIIPSWIGEPIEKRP